MVQGNYWNYPKGHKMREFRGTLQEVENKLVLLTSRPLSVSDKLKKYLVTNCTYIVTTITTEPSDELEIIALTRTKAIPRALEWYRFSTGCIAECYLRCTEQGLRELHSIVTIN